RSGLSLHKFGFKFLTTSIWDPVAEQFGALPAIYGTVVSSLLAVALAVPLSLGTALFITEICPRRLRGMLSLAVEMLAAIPSVKPRWPWEPLNGRCCAWQSCEMPAPESWAQSFSVWGARWVKPWP